MEDFIQVMHSDPNDQNQIIRIRFSDLTDDQMKQEADQGFADHTESAVQFIKSAEK